MPASEPSSTFANRIGAASEKTWAYLRSPIWPGTGITPPDNNFAANHSAGYPLSLEVTGNPLPLHKSFEFRRTVGQVYAWNLPLGVNYVVDPSYEPPDPNPNQIIARLVPKLVIGFGAGGYNVYQGTIVRDPLDPESPFTNELGYDYWTTRGRLYGTVVNITCRFWPIPYVDEFTWQSFTATTTITDEMFPDNQDWNIPSNRAGGNIIFVGSGNLISNIPPQQLPPQPWEINWINLPD